jgi:hypothetical protein
MSIKTQLLQKDIEAYFDAEREIRTQRYALDAGSLTAALVMFHREVAKLGMTADQYRTLAAEFAATLRAIKRESVDMAGPVANGIAVKAAQRAGMLEGVGDVGMLEPWRVRDLAMEIIAAMNAAYEVPKN